MSEGNQESLLKCSANEGELFEEKALRAGVEFAKRQGQIGSTQINLVAQDFRAGALWAAHEAKAKLEPAASTQSPPSGAADESEVLKLRTQVQIYNKALKRISVGTGIYWGEMAASEATKALNAAGPLKMEASPESPLKGFDDEWFEKVQKGILDKYHELGLAATDDLEVARQMSVAVRFGARNLWAVVRAGMATLKHTAESSTPDKRKDSGK